MSVLDVLALVAWTLAATCAGWWAARRGEANRLNELVQIALDVQREALTDDDALALYRSLYLASLPDLGPEGDR